MHRFFLPNLQQLTLTGVEAHHCLTVLRLKTGDTVTVFDGRGHEAQCRIEAIDRNTVQLTALLHATTPALPFRLTLAQAIPKKNMDWIVQKATELGVAGIQPLLSERTIVKVEAEDTGKMERWQATALEACKQCGNNWLPEIHAPRKAKDFLTAPGTFDLKLIASLQPDAQPLKKLLESAPGAKSALILIGPEGDFTPAELSLAKSAGCLPLSLGPLVLRADTAAFYALSILHHELQPA